MIKLLPFARQLIKPDPLQQISQTLSEDISDCSITGISSGAENLRMIFAHLYKPLKLWWVLSLHVSAISTHRKGFWEAVNWQKELVKLYVVTSWRYFWNRHYRTHHSPPKPKSFLEKGQRKRMTSLTSGFSLFHEWKCCH